MTESTAVVPTVADAKKGKKAGIKKPKTKPTHPPTSSMVDNAIKSLKERGGSSLPAIKKYLAANYKVDAEKLAPFIRKYLKGGVVSGKLIQTKGKGASGSFKLAASKKEKSEKTKKISTTKTSKPKVTKVKKAASPKKKVKIIKKKTATTTAKTAKKTGEVKVKAPKEKKPTKKVIKATKPKKVAKSPKKVAKK